jgi:hypothetical protein
MWAEGESAGYLCGGVLLGTSSDRIVRVKPRQMR